MKRDRLVVAGGGIAGLAAAAAAADHFDEVIVLDRGRRPSRRSGARSHRAQLHNILTRGQWQLEQVFPGYRAAFLAAGGSEGDVARDTHVHEFGGDGVNRSLGLSIWSAPWETLWEVSRGLLPTNVQLRYGALVSGLDVRQGSLVGLHLATGARSELIEADAVVDATGHASGFVGLLCEVGAEAPRIEVQRLDRWFVTTRLRRPSAMVGRPDYWMTFGEPPERKVALVSPRGDDEWLLSVSSQQASSVPPADYESILNFIDELAGPPLRPLVGDATPLGNPDAFWRREARWRRYEEIAAPLAGFAPVGDAFASINPIFGQGVGVAAWQASLLQAALATNAEADAWTRSYLQSAGEVVAQAWALDCLPSAADESGWADLLPRLADDIDLHRRYVGLWHLVEPASSLPELVATARTSTSSRWNAE